MRSIARYEASTGPSLLQNLEIFHSFFQTNGCRRDHVQSACYLECFKFIHFVDRRHFILKNGNQIIIKDLFFSRHQFCKDAVRFSILLLLNYNQVLYIVVSAHAVAVFAKHKRAVFKYRHFAGVMISY